MSQTKKKTSSSAKSETAKKTRTTKQKDKKETQTKKTRGKAAASQKKTSSMNPEIRRELIHWGIVLFLMIVTLGIYLRESMGIFGIAINSFFVGLFGFSAYLITLYSMVIAFIYLFGKGSAKLWLKLWYGYAFILLLAALLHVINGRALTSAGMMYSEATARTGGLVGGGIGGGLAAVIGNVGAILVIIFAIIILIIALSQKSLVKLLKVAGIKGYEGSKKVVQYTEEKKAEVKLKQEEKQAYQLEQQMLTMGEANEAGDRQISIDVERQQAYEYSGYQPTYMKKEAEEEIYDGSPIKVNVVKNDVVPQRVASSSIPYRSKKEMHPLTQEESNRMQEEVLRQAREAQKKPRVAQKGALDFSGPKREAKAAPEEMTRQEKLRERERLRESQLDFPAVAKAGSSYWDKLQDQKRRYEERRQREMQEIDQNLMTPEEEAPVFEENAASATAEAPEILPEETYEVKEPEVKITSQTLFTEEKPAEEETSAFTEEADHEEDLRGLLEKEPVRISEVEKDPIFEENDPYTEDEWQAVMEVSEDLPKEEIAADDVFGSVREIEETDYSGISTEKAFEKESFPTGYEERRETAEKNTVAENKPQEPAFTPAKVVGPTGKYEFPPIDLLNRAKNEKAEVDKEELLRSAKGLEDVLMNFGVEAKVIQVNQGPAVTRYELQPKTGVKVSRIVSLTDDIAMNLAAQSIRIEAPIPGKSAVGIEVPNKETSMVPLREVIDSNEFRRAPSKLTFSLGKDIDGMPRVADVAKMPHMLIAGSTGSGKSVCINSLIVSLLYKADPNEVKLILIDPKVVELSVYNGIPHLLLPVVNDPKQASATLNWAVQEMTRRYKRFADMNVRDLKGYNQLMEEKASDDPRDQKLPQIVIIIDELADLMMVASKEVEASICRLAQMARAAGMHLVIATQRPSVDVITGLIKANIPSRIAFAVSSGIDSRTILDSVGAEKLLGKGDMLFNPIGSNKPVRIQGTFVSDKEVEDVVEFLKQTGAAPSYNTEIISQAERESGSEDNGISDEYDEYLDEAIKFVIEKDKASISMLQRKFRIGFNRAARLMDALEERGVVGEDEGSKPRAVIMTKEQYEAEYT